MFTAVNKAVGASDTKNNIMDKLFGISLKGSKKSTQADAKVNSESEDDKKDVLDYFDKADHSDDTWDDSDEDLEHASSSSSLDEINLTKKEYENADVSSYNHLESIGANEYRGINTFDSSSKSSSEAYDNYSETKHPQVAESRSVEDDLLRWSDETAQEKGKFDINLNGKSELADKRSSKVIIDDGKRRVENLSLDQETSFELPKAKTEETDLLLCHYCIQDEKKTEAITYCMDCGLYMCSSCWRFHRKFVATRSHSVAFQQELIATEFSQYKPLTDENWDNLTTSTAAPTPMLDKKLVDSGKYSRNLTPTDNALCGPCQYESIDEPATHYCQDCGDYMCRDCFLFHQKLSESYNEHHVLHQSNCEDFDTFVPAVDEDVAREKETKSLKDQFSKLYKQPNSDKHKEGHFRSFLQPIGTFNVKLTCDPWMCSVVGIDCFSDGRIVLIDNSNNNVKLFGSGYQPLGNLDLPGQPADVAIVTDQKVAVFLPSESRLAFIMISGTSLSLLRTLKTTSKYARIAARCEEIYALCDTNGEGCAWVHILNEHGEIVTFIQLDLAQSDTQFSPVVPSLAVSPAGGTVYLSDINHCVYAFGLDGRLIFKHENLEIFDITSLSADSRSVYACCKELNCVFRVSYDGTDSEKVVSKPQGIEAPQSVAVKGNLLLVGLCDSYVVQIYSIK